MKRLIGLLISAAVSVAAAQSLSTAIQRGDDIQKIRALIASGAGVNQADADGATPLMHAAIYSTVECMRLLIDKGANVNAAAKSGRTALLSAIGEPAKARLLIEHGADVNAQSQARVTPLGSVARLEAGEETALLLIEKGAKADPSVIRRAASAGQLRLLRKIVTAPPPSAALVAAADGGYLDVVRFLLDAGAKPDVEDESKITALHLAANKGDAPMVKLLLERQAAVDPRDARGHTPLMMAAGADFQSLECVKLLLAAGADPKRKDMFGDDAAAWAAKIGDTPIARLLGAKPSAATASIVPAASSPLPSVRDAIQRAVKVMQPPGPKFFELNQCISCHHTSIPQMALARVRSRGIEIDAAIERKLMEGPLTSWSDRAEQWRQSLGLGGGFIANTSYGLIGLAAQGHPPGEMTAAAAHALSKRQFADGSWNIPDTRPPLGVGRIKWTALVLRAIQLYGPPGAKEEYDARIARARVYLERAQPADTQGHVFQLLGLKWAGATPKQLEPLARKLEQLQRDGGGWAQRPEMQPDTYATGQALWALHDAAGRRGSEPVYQRGAMFLRQTQLADGSWHVKNRAFGFQPLKDTGFPHGRDQWISSAATAFAIIALEPLIEEPKVASR